MTTIKRHTPYNEKLAELMEAMMDSNRRVGEAIEGFEEAVEENTIKGSRDPEDLPLIEQDYDKWKIELIKSVLDMREGLG